MDKVSYIIPLHVFDDSVKTMLPNAITSIKDTKTKEFVILFVGPKDVLDQVVPIAEEAKLVKSQVKYIENDGDTDFFSQVNKAALKCTTKFFCIVEYDDAIMEYWPAVFERYEKTTSASVMLSIIELVENGQWVSWGNEMAWNGAFANDIGKIDLDCLEKYMDFNVTGAFINTEDFIKTGMLKPSLKFAAWYEFLLRACHNGLTVYVAPKLCYSHTINREGSFMLETTKSVSKEEGAWLIETAKQEYFFKEDRKKVWGEESTEINDTVNKA